MRERRRILWSCEEEMILKNTWSNTPKTEIMKLLPLRSWDSIRIRASHLQLIRRAFAYKEYSRLQSKKRLVSCEICGKEVLRKPNQIKTRKHIFCSPKCHGRWLSANPSANPSKGLKWKESSRIKLSTIAKERVGNKNSNWRGGLTKYNHMFFNSKKSILERDSYKCQICGKQTGYLQIHHVIPLKEATIPEEVNKLNQPDNLITICLPCHNHVHPEKYLFQIRQRDFVNGRFIKNKI